MSSYSINPHVLYRFFATSGDLLYVGITGNPERRFSAHSHVQPWWDRVARIELERFGTRGELVEAEIAAIQSEHPKYNKTHSAGLLQTLRTSRKAEPVSTDANRFGNYGPPTTPDREPREGALFGCPVCHNSVTRPLDVYAKPAGDWECSNCVLPRTWTAEEWDRANGYLP